MTKCASCSPKRERNAKRDGCRSSALTLDDLVRQFVATTCRSFREMFRERFAGFLDRFDQRVIEFFIRKMRAQRIDDAFPELLAALFVNRLIANDRELVRARRHEDQNGVSFARSMHAELVESLGRGGERIAFQFSALHINADLP